MSLRCPRFEFTGTHCLLTLVAMETIKNNIAIIFTLRFY